VTSRRFNPGLFTALWLLPLIALLQIGLAPHFTVRGALPGLMLVMVVNWGILRGVEEGIIWAFIGGLCIDSLSGWPFGTSTVALVLVTFGVSLGHGTFIRTHVLLPPATIFGATVLYYLIALFVLVSTQHDVSWLAALGSMVLPAALYNSILNIPGFWLAQRLEQRVYPTPRANW
jgi:rod shape-determining protein MreD